MINETIQGNLGVIKNMKMGKKKGTNEAGLWNNKNDTLHPAKYYTNAKTNLLSIRALLPQCSFLEKDTKNNIVILIGDKEVSMD